MRPLLRITAAARRRAAATGGRVLPPLVLLGCFAVAAHAQQEVKHDGLPQAPSAVLAATGSVSGVVKDVGGTPVPDATVTLSMKGLPDRSDITDDHGNFIFSAVPPGGYTVTFAEDGLAHDPVAGSLSLGEVLILPPVMMHVAEAQFSVDAISQHQAADLQLKQEETQRIMGFIPNFYVVYGGNQVPLTAGQKYKLAARSLYDPVSFAVNGIIAGIQQAQDDYDGFHQGAAGYGKRYIASYATFVTGTMIGGAVLPSLLHQDPRYFYKGTGSVASRTFYALSTAVRQKGDNGKWQVGYSSVLGDLSSGVISSYYYPATNRSAALVFANAGLAVAGDGIGNLIQEFLIKHMTPKTPKTPND